jgi:hypothetical protein
MSARKFQSLRPAVEALEDRCLLNAGHSAQLPGFVLLGKHQHRKHIHNEAMIQVVHNMEVQQRTAVISVGLKGSVTMPGPVTISSSNPSVVAVSETVNGNGTVTVTGEALAVGTTTISGSFNGMTFSMSVTVVAGVPGGSPPLGTAGGRAG